MNRTWPRNSWNTQRWGPSTTCTTELKTCCIEGSKRSSCMWTTLPVSQASTALPGEIPLRLWFFQWEKWTREGQPALFGIVVSLCGNYYSEFALWGLQRTLGFPATGSLTVTEWEERACNNQRDLGTLSLDLHCPSSNPNSSFTHLQKQVRCALWLGS